MPKCFSGSCFGCLTNSDCTSISTTPVCQNNVCAGCSSDSQCTGSTPYCGLSGACVSCKSNTDCKESTRPICTLEGVCSACSAPKNTCPNSLKCVPTGACVECAVSSTDCSGNTPICLNSVCVGCSIVGSSSTCAGLTVNSMTLAYCISKTGACVECTNATANGAAANSGCKATSATPICSSSNVCSACLSDKDCAGVNGAAGLFCDTNLDLNQGKCVACASSNHCTSETAPICSTALATLSTCVACTADTDCTSKSEALKKCNSLNGSCQVCLANSDCTSSSGITATSKTPICDKTSSTFKCRGCTLDSDCSGFSSSTPYCNSGTGQCVQCLPSHQNSQCTSVTAPICDSTSFTCRGCNTSVSISECTLSGLSVCASTGACVNCVTTSTDCSSNPLKPICVSNTCSACSKSSDCSVSNGFTLFPKYLCDTVSGDARKGACVNCVANNDCDSKSTLPICTDYACIGCEQDSNCTNLAGTNGAYCAVTGAQKGACVACNTNTNAGCAGATPICDSKTYTCRACTTNDCTTPGLNVCATFGSNKGMCVECEASSDCSPTSNTPICTLNNKCVACNQDTDCTSNNITSVYSQALKYCTTFAGSSKGSCVQCFASTQCHADSPSTPICNANQCAPCSTINPCTSLKPSVNCAITGSLLGSCFKCKTSMDCLNNLGALTATPVCSAAGTCVPCDLVVNTCSSLSLTPVCSSENTGKCVQCNKDTAATDCSYTPNTPICNEAHTCSACTTNAQCSAVPFTTTPVCKSGACVQCTQNSDCKTGPNLYCNIETNLCVACLTSNNCVNSPNLFCDTSSHTCRACKVSGDCSGMQPQCATSGLNSGKCVACTLNSQCKSETSPICSSTNVCVGCSDTNPCPLSTPNCFTAPGTSQGSCFTCSMNTTECYFSTGQSLSKTPLCSSSGLCVACNSTKNTCADVISSAPYCKIANESNVVIGPQCVTCNYDSDCSPYLNSTSSTPFCIDYTCESSLSSAANHSYSVNMQFKLAWKPTYADPTTDDYKALVAEYISFV